MSRTLPRPAAALVRLAARLHAGAAPTIVAVLVGVALSVAAGSAAGTAAGAHAHGAAGAGWSAAERAALRALSLSALEPLAPDPSNRVADDPRAAALGEALFHDSTLSGNGRVSCATCHDPARDFQDGVALARGVGTTTRRTMPIAGTAHGPWFFWDGRADSQWAQALGPVESAVEHGTTRTQVAHEIARRYRAEYAALFGPVPSLDGVPAQAGPVADTAWRHAWERLPPVRRDAITRVYANAGKAIAAFERRIALAPTRFDRYVDAELAGRPHDATSALTDDERAGLRLFVGKGSCVTCHNGARLTDDHFHNTGVPVPATALPPDDGRASGAPRAVQGEFACTSRWSDAPPEDCDELRFATTEGAELVRAYKTPSLRGVADRAPYMHAGQLATLEEVVAHYDRAPRAPAGHSELRPLRLSADDRRQLVAFLRTLSAAPVVHAAGGRPHAAAGPTGGATR